MSANTTPTPPVIPTYAAFIAANPIPHNHSSEIVLDPEVPVFVEASNNS